MSAPVLYTWRGFSVVDADKLSEGRRARAEALALELHGLRLELHVTLRGAAERLGFDYLDFAELDAGFAVFENVDGWEALKSALRHLAEENAGGARGAA